MSDDAPADLVSRARSTRVIVVGGGVAGLTAAVEFASIGMTVTLLERSGDLGGAVGTADLDGLLVDTGADCLLMTPAVRALIDRLGLDSQLVAEKPGAIAISGTGGTVPLPAEALSGIPANTWDPAVRRIIGWGGVWRAYLDRLRPPLTIGHAQSMGDLVAKRMGKAVRDRMVAPIARGVYGVEADLVDVNVAFPGLNVALTRTGSLGGAVSHLLGDDERPKRMTLAGGMGQLRDALVGELNNYDADVRTGVEVTAVAAAQHGWSVTTRSIAAETGEASDGQLDADIVVVATDERTARALLGAPVALPAEEAFSSASRTVVTMRVAPLDILTGGSDAALICAASTSDPFITISRPTRSWPSLAARAGGDDVLRVVLPAASPRIDANLDAVAIDTATAAAARSLGQPVHVRAAHVRDVQSAAPASVRGYENFRDNIRAAVHAQPGLSLVGAWVAGSGIAAVVADATAEADRLRSEMLWGAAGAADV